MKRLVSLHRVPLLLQARQHREIWNHILCQRCNIHGPCKYGRKQNIATFSEQKEPVKKPINSAELHDEFLNNFTDDAEAVDTSAKHFSSVRNVKPTKSGASKDRFRHGHITEGDMYSAKPVWQQLNDLESTWNTHFLKSGRIKSQKAISRAKKCAESLDCIESNQSKLVNVDCFRETFGEKNNGDSGSGVHSYNNSVVDSSSDRQAKGNPHIIANNASNAGLWMTKGTDISNTGNEPSGFLQGEGLNTDSPYDIGMRKGEGRRTNAKLSSEEEAVRAALAPSVLLKGILKEDDMSVIEGIFGKQNDGVIDAATPAAVIEATTRLEPETWLNMNPAHIMLQQSILKCKSSSQLLLAIADKVDQMNSVNVSTALHRLARYTNPNFRYMLSSNETFCRLVGVVEHHLPEFDCQGLTNIFWSVVRLRIQPPWLDSLMNAICKNASDLSVGELASSLYAVSKITVKNSSGVDLRDRLISLAQERVSHFTRPLDVTCVATALARLNVRNPILFGKLSSTVILNIKDFSMQHICGIAWAFASLGFTDRVLFSKIRQFIEENANLGAIRDVIHLGWALSKINEADKELFLCTISPFVRSHIGHLSCRDISTVAWSFVNAEVDDPDLFDDLASALQHHVDEMTTQDIAAAVAAFAHMEESHKQLFKKMRNRASALLQEFTPLQLAKIVRGFTSVADERFYGLLGKAVEAKVHLMLPENIVEIFMGLTEVGYQNNTLYKKLLDAISSSSRKLYAEDALLMLQVVTKLKQEPHDTAMSSKLYKVSYALIEQIEKRVGKWKCYNISHITSFFDCLNSMGMGGSKGDSTVKMLSKLCLSCINRLFSNKIDADTRNELFTKFTKACANLSPRKLAFIQAELSKNTQLMTAFHNCVASLRSGNFLESTALKVDAAHCLINIGYLDDGVVALCDDIVTCSDFGNNIDSIESIDTLSKAIWMFTESNLHLAWVKDKLRMISESNVEWQPCSALIRIMWSCVVLGEDAMLMRMLPNFVPLFNKLPEDMMLAQQVALHVLSCLPIRVEGDDNVNNANGIVADGDESYCVSRDVQSSLRDWLDYQRDDLYTVYSGLQKKRTMELDYDSLISESLIAMKIPHRTVHTIENIYRVSVSFPLENHVIDVLNFTDCFVPKGQARSRATLRQRQLQLLGYGVASLNLGSLYEAHRERRCKELMAETISGFCATALDYLPIDK